MFNAILLVGVLATASASITDDEILYEAKNSCRSAKPDKVDMKLLKNILAIYIIMIFLEIL